ncbi:MAG: sialidase family protein [Nitrosopumilaceae archaeon]
MIALPIGVALTIIFFIVFSQSAQPILPFQQEHLPIGGISKPPSTTAFITQVAVSGNHVYVLWQQENSTSKNNSVLLRTSTDNGFSFNRIINLTRGYDVIYHPAIVAKNNTLYLTWDDFGGGHTFIRKSIDGGITFGNVTLLKDGDGISAGTSIFLNENDLHAILYNANKDSNGYPINNGIILRSSFDNGNSFGKTVDLYGEPYSDRNFLKLAISGKNIYTLGLGKEISQGMYTGVLFRKSSDNGQTFSSVLNLTGSIYLSDASIAASGNKVYVLVEGANKTRNDLFFTRSIDGGLTFDKMTKLNNGTASTWFSQLLAYGQNGVYVKWNSDDSNGEQIVLRKSIDGGSTFDKTINITQYIKEALPFSPVGILSENELYAIWEQSSTTPVFHKQIFFTTSIDGGQTFSVPIDLNQDNGDYVGIRNLQIVSSGDKIYLAGDSGGDIHGIFLRISTDGGNTFSHVIHVS